MGMMAGLVWCVQSVSIFPEENESGVYSRALKGGISCCFSDRVPGGVSHEVNSLLLKLPESDSAA